MPKSKKTTFNYKKAVKMAQNVSAQLNARGKAEKMFRARVDQFILLRALAKEMEDIPLQYVSETMDESGDCGTDRFSVAIGNLKDEIRDGLETAQAKLVKLQVKRGEENIAPPWYEIVDYVKLQSNS